jgi:hypothetical protein
MKPILKVALGCFALVIACCGLYRLYDWLTTPVIHFTWEELFIDPNTFTWMTERSQISDGSGCIDSPVYTGCIRGLKSKRVTYSFEEPLEAEQDVGYYRTEKRATDDYSRVKAFLLEVNPNETAYQTPQTLQFRGEKADQFDLACHTDTQSGESKCTMLGQYKKFIVFFIMSGEPTNPALFEQAVRVIDQKMVQYAARY